MQTSKYTAQIGNCKLILHDDYMRVIKLKSVLGEVTVVNPLPSTGAIGCTVHIVAYKPTAKQ
jgi:hypothetical protein